MKKNLLIESDKIKSLINRMDKKLSYDEYVIYESKQLLTEIRVPLKNRISGSLNNIRLGRVTKKISKDIVNDLTNINKFLDGDVNVVLKGNTDEIIEALVDSNVLGSTEKLIVKKYLETIDGLSRLGKGGQKSDILDVLVKDGTPLNEATEYMIDVLIENQEVALKKLKGYEANKLRKIIDDPNNVSLRQDFISSFFSDVWKNWDNMSESFKAKVIRKVKDLTTKQVQEIAALDEIAEDMIGTKVLYKTVDGKTRIIVVNGDGLSDIVEKALKENGWAIENWKTFTQNAGMKGSGTKQVLMYLKAKTNPIFKWYKKNWKYMAGTALASRVLECFLLSDKWEKMEETDKTTNEKFVIDYDFLDCLKPQWVGEQDYYVPDDWKPKYFTWEGILLPLGGQLIDLIYFGAKNTKLISFKKMLQYIKMKVGNEYVDAKEAFFDGFNLIQIIRNKCSVNPEDVRIMRDGIKNKLKRDLGDDVPDDEFGIGIDEMLGLGMDKYETKLDDFIDKYQNKVADLDKLRDDIKDQYEKNKKYKLKVNVDEYPELDFTPDVEGKLKESCIVAQTNAAIKSYNAHNEIAKSSEKEGASMEDVYENTKWNLEWYTTTGKLNNESTPNNVSVEACEYNKDKFKNMLQIFENKGMNVKIENLDSQIVCSKENMDKLKMDLENSYLLKTKGEEIINDLENDEDGERLLELVKNEESIDVKKLALRSLFCWEMKTNQYYPINSYIDMLLNLKLKEGGEGGNYLKNIVLNLRENTDWKKGSGGYNFKLKGEVIDTVGERICNCSDGKTKNIKYNVNGTEVNAYDYCMKAFKQKLKDEGIFNKFSDGSSGSQ